MKKIFRICFIIILIIVLLIAFSGSYRYLSIDNIAIVVAMSVDASDDNNLNVNFQFTNPSSVSESGSTEQSPSILYSINASSVSSAINLMDTYIGKKLNFSHCKIITFSEELAYKGISEEIYSLINNSQVRPSTNIVITKCLAKDYIENSKPLAENLITEYYEIFVNSNQYTGHTSNATIGDFFNALNSDSYEPYAILGGLSTASESQTEDNSQKDTSNKSSGSPSNDGSSSKNSGLAVFKRGILVGELNSIETLSFLATKNDLNSFLISAPDPENDNSYIDVNFIIDKPTSIKTKIVNGSPYISVEYDFSGRIFSMQQDSKYLDDEILKEISNSCSNYLQSVFSSYLYKTSKDLKSDINQFGKTAKSCFITNTAFNDYNWNEKYKDSFFDVTVNCPVRSGFLLTET